MAKRQNNVGATETTSATLGFEAQLWAAANALRGSMDAAEDNDVVLSLIFLKDISDAFREHRKRLAQEPWADPEDADEYRAANVFWVPAEARRTLLEEHARPAPDNQRHGQLIDLKSSISHAKMIQNNWGPAGDP